MNLRYLATLALALAGGWCAARWWAPVIPGNTSTLRSAAALQCPMHPWIASDKAAKCTVCGMDLVSATHGGPASPADGRGIVMLPQGSPNVIGVQTAIVSKQPLKRTLRISGMIGEDESRHAVISAPVEGRLDGLAMNHDGQPITRRQPLATIFSRTLLNAAEEYKTALAQNSPALEQTKRRLEQYGLVWEQIKGIPQRQPDDIYFGILAPVSGVIIKSYVHEGQYVKEGERLFEIADFTRMWFMFDAYEQDLPFLQLGQIVTLSSPSLPDKTLKSRVAFISPNLNEQTRTSSVRVVLENPDRKLKNNTYAEGTIELEAPEVLAISRTAVLWPGNAPRVYVELSPGAYQQRSVKLGRAGDTLWEVLEGLKDGESVVANGTMLIDGQAQLESLAAVPEPITHTTEADPILTAYLHQVAAINAALAEDNLAAANAALGKLPPAPVGVIKSAAPTANTDIKALRMAFLPWSQEIAAVAATVRLKVPDLRIFRCPMTNELWSGAPANAGWIQFSSEVRNPYWGKAMLDCGMEVKP